MKDIFIPGEFLLPRNTDLARWSVIACDQFTSRPEYWSEVEALVGDAPSTLRLMLRLAHETGKTIFLSTHDVEMAIQLSDALWIVQEGKIQAGTTASLTESGTLQRFLHAEGITYDTKEHTLKIT